MTTQFHKSDNDQLETPVVSKQLMLKLVDPTTDEVKATTPAEIVLDPEMLQKLLRINTQPADGVTRGDTGVTGGFAFGPVNPAVPAEPKIYKDEDGLDTIDGFKFYEQQEKNRSYNIDDLTATSYDDPSKKDYTLTNALGIDNIVHKIGNGYRPYIKKSIIGKFNVPLSDAVKNLIDNVDPQNYSPEQARSVIEPYIDYFAVRFNPQLRLVLFKKVEDNPFDQNIVLRQKPLKYDNQTGRISFNKSKNNLFPAINTSHNEVGEMYDILKYPANSPNQQADLPEMLTVAQQLLIKFKGYSNGNDPLNNLYQLWFYKPTKVPLLNDGNYGSDPWNDGYKVTTDVDTGADANDFPPYYPDNSTPYVNIWIYASKIWNQAHGIVPPDPVIGHDDDFTGPFTRIGAIQDSTIRITGAGNVVNDNPDPHDYFILKKGDVLKGYFPKVKLHPSTPAGHIFLKTE